MEWFTVKYRQPDGAVAEAEFEAADRAALFKVLSEQNISAISIASNGIKKKKITRGGSTTIGSSTNKSTNKKIMRWGVTTVVVVVLLFALHSLLMSSESIEETNQKVRPRRGSDAVKIIPKKAVEKTVEESPVPVSYIKDTKRTQQFGQYTAETDENGDRWITRNGRKRKLVSVKPGVTKQLFFNMAENQISAIVTVKPGDMIVGFDITDRFVSDFKQSLNTPIEFSDDDTPEEREEKEMVKYAKEQLKSYMDQGADIAEIMREEYKNIAKMNALKTDLLNDLAQMRRQGASAEEIELQIKSSNELLRRYGVEHGFKLLKRERMELGIDSGSADISDNDK